MTMSTEREEERRCPDDGACHHNCAANECFRVRAALPLSEYGEDWTAADKKRFGGPPAKPRIEDLLTS